MRPHLKTNPPWHRLSRRCTHQARSLPRVGPRFACPTCPDTLDHLQQIWPSQPLRVINSLTPFDVYSASSPALSTLPNLTFLPINRREIPQLTPPTQSDLLTSPIWPPFSRPNLRNTLTRLIRILTTDPQMRNITPLLLATLNPHLRTITTRLMATLTVTNPCHVFLDASLV